MKTMNLMHILMSVLAVHAYPVTSISNVGGEAKSMGLNEHPGARTIVVAVCITYVLALSLVQGYRAGRLAENMHKTSIADVLVFVQSFVCIAFAISLAVIAGGLGLTTNAQCHAGMRLCIIFYGIVKIALYLFLLERAHIVRAPFVSRKRDIIWLIGFAIIVVGFGGFIIYEFVTLRSEPPRENGLCRSGIYPNAIFAVMAFDSVISIALNGVFIWLLRPVLSSRANPNQLGSVGSQRRNRTKNTNLSRAESLIKGLIEIKRDRASFQDTVKGMLWRSVIGSTLILIFTIANNTVFLTVKVASLNHLCMLTCLTDLTGSVLVINWLWLRSNDEPVGSAPAQSATTALSSFQS